MSASLDMVSLLTAIMLLLEEQSGGAGMVNDEVPTLLLDKCLRPLAVPGLPPLVPGRDAVPGRGGGKLVNSIPMTNSNMTKSKNQIFQPKIKIGNGRNSTNT